MRRVLISSDVLLGTIRQSRNTTYTALERMEVLDESGALDLLLTKATDEEAAHRVDGTAGDAASMLAGYASAAGGGSINSGDTIYRPRTAPKKQQNTATAAITAGRNSSTTSGSPNGDTASNITGGGVGNLSMFDGDASFAPPTEGDGYDDTNEYIPPPPSSTRSTHHHGGGDDPLSSPPMTPSDQLSSYPYTPTSAASGGDVGGGLSSTISGGGRRTTRTTRGTRGALLMGGVGGSIGMAGTDPETAAALQQLLEQRNQHVAAGGSAMLSYGNFGRNPAAEASTHTTSGPASVNKHVSTAYQQTRGNNYTNGALTTTSTTNAAPAQNILARYHDMQQQVAYERWAKASLLAEEKRKNAILVSELCAEVTDAIGHLDKVFVEWLQRLVTAAHEAEEVSGGGLSSDDVFMGRGDIVGGREGTYFPTTAGGGGASASPWESATYRLGSLASTPTTTTGGFGGNTIMPTAIHQAQVSPVSCFETILMALSDVLRFLTHCHNMPLPAARQCENTILTFLYRIVVSLAEFPDEVRRSMLHQGGLPSYNNNTNGLNADTNTTATANLDGDGSLPRDYDTRHGPHGGGAASAAANNNNTFSAAAGGASSSGSSSVLNFKALFAQIITPHMPFFINAATLQMKAVQRREVTIVAGPPITLFQSAAKIDPQTGMREVIPNVVALTPADDYLWVTCFAIAVFGGDRMVSFLASRCVDTRDEPYHEVLVQSVCACMGLAIKITTNRVMRMSGLLEDITEPPLPIAAVVKLVPEIVPTMGSNNTNAGGSSSSTTTNANNSRGRALLKITMDEAAFITHMSQVTTRIIRRYPYVVHLPSIVGTMGVVSWLAMTMTAVDPTLPLPLRHAGDSFNPPQQGPMGTMTRMVLSAATGVAMVLASTAADAMLPAVAFTPCHQQCMNSVLMLYVAWALQQSHAIKMSAAVAAESERRRRRQASPAPIQPSQHGNYYDGQASTSSPSSSPISMVMTQAEQDYMRCTAALSRLLIKLLARSDAGILAEVVGGGGGGGGGNNHSHNHGHHQHPYANQRRLSPAAATEYSASQRLFATTQEEKELQRVASRLFLRALSDVQHLAGVNAQRLINAVPMSQLRHRRVSNIVAAPASSGSSEAQQPFQQQQQQQQFLEEEECDCLHLLNTAIQTILLDSINNVYHHDMLCNHRNPYVSGGGITMMMGSGGSSGFGASTATAAMLLPPLTQPWHVSMWQECLRIGTLHSHVLSGGKRTMITFSAASPTSARRSTSSAAAHNNTTSDYREGSNMHYGDTQHHQRAPSPTTALLGGISKILGTTAALGTDSINNDADADGGTSAVNGQHGSNNNNSDPFNTAPHTKYTSPTSPFASLTTTVDAFEAYWNLATTALRTIDHTSNGSMYGRPMVVGSLASVGLGGSSGMAASSRVGLGGVTNANNNFSSLREAMAEGDWSDYASWSALANSNSGGGGGVPSQSGALVTTAGSAASTIGGAVNPLTVSGPQSLIDRLSATAAATRLSQYTVLPHQQQQLLHSHLIDGSSGSGGAAPTKMSGELLASFRYLSGCILSSVLQFDEKVHPSSHKVANGFELAGEYLTAFAQLLSKTAELPQTFSAHFHDCAVGFYRKALLKVAEESAAADVADEREVAKLEQQLNTTTKTSTNLPPPQVRQQHLQQLKQQMGQRRAMRATIMANLKRRIVENEVGYAAAVPATLPTTSATKGWKGCAVEDITSGAADATTPAADANVDGGRSRQPSTAGWGF